MSSSSTRIQTKSFQLAVAAAGNPQAEKLALLLPGRLESKDYAHLQSHAAYLADQGYYAVAFDPPGSWDSHGNIDTYTVTNYLQATRELIEYYGSKPTLLLGHSVGGGVAILAAADNPFVTRLVLLMTNTHAPTPDDEWKTAGFIRFLRDLPPGDGPTATKKQYDLPYSYLEDSHSYDRIAALQRCKQPKLFIAGAHDTQNLPEEVRAAYNLAPDPKKFVELDCAHGYRYSSAAIHSVNEAIGSFLKLV